MTIFAKQQRSLISSEQKLIATGTHNLKQSETMNKLIWQLYNDNMISEEIANLLLDKHYNRLNNKRYR